MDDGPLHACLQVHKALMTSKDAKAFLEPVDWRALNIPSYPQIIKVPMDLGTIQTKLVGAQYRDHREWEQDVRLVVNNCKSFNLPDTMYFKMAEHMEAFLDKRLPKLNKELQLWSSLSDASLWLDWREKSMKVLSELRAAPEAQIFLMPVDWRAMRLMDYPEKIKQPMDLFTVEQKLCDRSMYSSPHDFVQDVWLIWRNAMVYNQPFTLAYKNAKKMMENFRHRILKAFAVDEEDESGGTKRRKLEAKDKITITDHDKTAKVNDYEFTNLRNNMAKLSAEDLQRSVFVAQERNVSSVVTTMDNVTLDLDMLSPGDFRYLAKFVAVCTGR